MKNKFLLVNLDEEKTKRLAEVIASSTSRKILNHLADKESTESELSKSLNLPLSTVHYHLQKLQEGGLITAEEFHYSKKRLFIPFQAIQWEDTALESIRFYTTQFVFPSEYYVVSSIPVPSRTQWFTNWTYYEFRIDVTETDLMVILENQNKADMKTYMIILITAFLGIGTSIVAQETIRLIRFRGYSN